MKKLMLIAAAFTLAASTAHIVGCATGQPASKQQVVKAYDNTITLKINVYAPEESASAAAQPDARQEGSASKPARSAKSVATASPPVSIYISDLLGSQKADASAGANDSTEQRAAPQLSAGLTGDKPIEAAAETAKTAITGGASQAGDAAGELAAKAAQKIKERLAQQTSTNAVAAAQSGSTTNCVDCQEAPGK